MTGVPFIFMQLNLIVIHFDRAEFNQHWSYRSRGCLVAQVEEREAIDRQSELAALSIVPCRKLPAEVNQNKYDWEVGSGVVHADSESKKQGMVSGHEDGGGDIKFG